MTDVLDDVRDHYRAAGPTERLKSAPMALGQVSFQTASALELPFDDGRFASFDVVLNGAEPHYPVPRARTPATSFLLALCRAGLCSPTQGSGLV